MLSEAKDTSELMVDLGYASLFFADTRMADEVTELEERLTELIHEMREVCVLAARSKRDAEQMSSVLHVVSAIERMGNAAVDVSRIVTHRLGIPPALVADLAAAEEVSHRVRIRAGSALADRSLAEVELPMEVGMRVVALRRGREWLFDPDGEDLLLPDDVLILRGAREGHRRGSRAGRRARVATRRRRGRPRDHRPRPRRRRAGRHEERVGSGGRASPTPRCCCATPGLAAQVSQLEDRLDEMREQLELWVLRAAAETVDPSGLRGLLHLGAASEEVGDAAQQLVWLVEEDEEMHPVLAVALGETDDVVVQYPVAAGQPLDGAVVGGTQVGDDTGFHLLAIRRGGR